jgi:hypothetical protein
LKPNAARLVDDRYSRRGRGPAWNVEQASDYDSEWDAV